MAGVVVNSWIEPPGTLVHMPHAHHYRKLAREYSLRAQRAPSPLFAEGYRKLAHGYESLAQGYAKLVQAHRSTNDRLNGGLPRAVEAD